MDDDSQLVTVTCSEHHDALVNGLWDFYSSQRGTDFHVHVGGQSMQAHQLILEVFLSPQKLGLCALQERQTSINLAVLLEFLYKGSVTVKKGQLESLLEAANELDFKMLVTAIESTDDKKNCNRKARRRRKGKPVKRLNGNSDDVQFDDPGTPGGSNPASPAKADGAGMIDDWSPPSKKRPRKKPNRQTKTKVKTVPTSTGDGDDDDNDNDNVESEPEPEPVATEGGRSSPLCRIKCKECSYTTRHDSRFKLHMARRHDPNANLLPCEKCHKSFISAALLANHMILHAKKPTNFACPNCPYQTTKVSNYYHHLRASHEMTTSGEPIQKRYSCTDCPYKTTFRFKLRLHRDAVHSNVKSFKCDQCDYQAAMQRNLHRHIKVTHLKIRPFICEVCASTFTTISHLTKHHKVHTGEKPYVCSVDSCQKAYASQYAFKAHVRRHEGFDDKIFVCDVCGFACNRKDNLRVHLRNVHDRKQTL